MKLGEIPASEEGLWFLSTVECELILFAVDR
jgi:hypothetical protein